VDRQHDQLQAWLAEARAHLGLGEVFGPDPTPTHCPQPVGQPLTGAS
jgi:hypothetical protein